ncbi:MAG: terminase small subunit [Betaproteobacteria bacterium]
MNQQQLDFVNHYIANGLKNATRSAIAAGYSPKIARVRASKLKKHPEIRSAIADRQAELSDRHQLDRDALIIMLLQAYFNADSTFSEVYAVKEIGKLLGYYD